MGRSAFAVLIQTFQGYRVGFYCQLLQVLLYRICTFAAAIRTLRMSDLLKTAMVTGASRGIGKGIAEELARQGYQVFLTYVSKPKEAEDVASGINASGGSARAFRLDVGDPAVVAAFFQETIKDKVALAVLVNNAGITKDGLMARMKDEDWDAVLNVNLRGAFACTREAAKLMTKQRYGRIINISSISGQMGNAGQINYSAAKAGLIGLTKASARELAGRNITVNAIAPGFIETDMTAKAKGNTKDDLLSTIPLQRAGTPEDVAALATFLAGPGASFITGEIIKVDGGMCI